MLLSIVLFGQLVAQPTLPIQIDDAKIMPLRKLVDSSLQLNLESELRTNSEWRKLIEQKKNVGRDSRFEQP